MDPYEPQTLRLDAQGLLGKLMRYGGGERIDAVRRLGAAFHASG